MVRRIPVAGLCLVADINARARAHPGVVSRYADLLTQGVTLPPIIVYEDAELSTTEVPALIVGDGFMRLEAHKKIGRQEILADVHPGSERDAVLAACSQLGSELGYVLEAKEKRMNVVRVLSDPAWVKRPNAWIGRMCQVDESVVRRVRKVVGVPLPPSLEVKQGGSTYVAVEKLVAKGEPVQEIAKKLDISRNAVHRVKRAAISKSRSRGPSPLQTIYSQVEQASDTFALAGENFQPKWAKASPLHVAEFVRMTRVLSKNMRAFVERLKKEADDTATKGTDQS